ncbi:MAG: nucleotide sugar dehydrogenase, partial [Firmicutes bacterium]|nr:nucleotide sugar dehydrogenase [Bacillota bacterium]
DVLLICVPTPLNQHQEPDLSYVINVTSKLTSIVRKGQLIILESTTYPGTTRDVLRPILESTGLRVGEDIFLAFSPERVDPGNPRFQTHNIPKVVGGITKRCTELAALFYSQALEHVHLVSSPEVAEMTKVFENTYRAVNIALVNELAMLCGRMGLDVWEVIDAAATKPFGIQTFYPGPGVGGHCIPLDPYYLAWKAREYDFLTRFIELAGEINRSMPRYVVQKLQSLLNDDHKSIKGSRILLLGIAYKGNSNDDRESPALQIFTLLEKYGAEVMYHDPFIAAVRPQTSFPRSVCSVPYTTDILKAVDAVVITTDHRDVDYGLALKYARLIFDTRNVTRGLKASGGRLVRL